jgi:kinesin family protein 20
MKKVHATTSLNPLSSRSHTIFKIIMRYNHIISGEYQECSLSMVDLAGSERAYRAETSGKELQQACKINQSLSVLGKCLDAMRHNSIYTQKKIVPFRESKLTMIFQEYFQGDQNITMITNINPSKEDFEESLRVLNYACTAKEIKPIRSRIVTGNILR